MRKQDNTEQQPSQPTLQTAQTRGPSWRRWVIVGLAALGLLYIMNILAGAIPAPWSQEDAPVTVTRSAGGSQTSPPPTQTSLPTPTPLTPPPAAQSKPISAVQASATGEIHLPSASLPEGKAQFYAYTDPSGQRVQFLAVKDAQGTVHTAIDNCKECFHAHKGYTQQGQELICGECGKGFPIAYLGDAAGDCHPLDLRSTATGDDIVVTVADLAAANAAGSNPAAPAPSHDAKGPAARVQPNAAGEIRLPAAALADGKAQFYEYANPFGGQIRFFAVRDAQGTLHAALDNCQDCFQARRGYTQRGPEMVCRNCGRSSPIASINKASGGCNPIGLPFTLAGEGTAPGSEIVIKTADLVTLDTSGAASTAAPEQPGRLRF